MTIIQAPAKSSMAVDLLRVTESFLWNRIFLPATLTSLFDICARLPFLKMSILCLAALIGWEFFCFGAKWMEMFNGNVTWVQCSYWYLFVFWNKNTRKPVLIIFINPIISSHPFGWKVCKQWRLTFGIFNGNVCLIFSQLVWNTWLHITLLPFYGPC